MSDSSFFNRFNKEWARQGILDNPSDAQSDVGFAYMGQAPPTVEQFNSLHQWMDKKDNWLYGQIAEVIKFGEMEPDSADLFQLLEAIRGMQRIKLTGPLTLYVDNTIGDDVNGDGSFITPWRTVTRAVWFVQNEVDPAGNTIVVQLLTQGVYDPIHVLFPINGFLLVRGNPDTPELMKTYIIRNTNGPAVVSDFTMRIALMGLSIEAQGIDVVDFETQGNGLLAANSGHIYYEDCAFGPCSHSHMLGIASGYCHNIRAATHHYIYGSSPSHVYAAQGGICGHVRATVHLEPGVHFSNGFAVSGAGYTQVWGSTFIGAATGQKFYATHNGVINSNGAGWGYLPGSIVVDESNINQHLTYGGQYI